MQPKKKQPVQKRVYVRKIKIPKKVVCEGCNSVYRLKNKQQHESNKSHIRLTKQKKWNDFFMRN